MKEFRKSSDNRTWSLLCFQLYEPKFSSQAKAYETFHALQSTVQMVCIALYLWCWLLPCHVVSSHCLHLYAALPLIFFIFCPALENAMHSLLHVFIPPKMKNVLIAHNVPVGTLFPFGSYSIKYSENFFDVATVIGSSCEMSIQNAFDAVKQYGDTNHATVCCEKFAPPQAHSLAWIQRFFFISWLFLSSELNHVWFNGWVCKMLGACASCISSLFPRIEIDIVRRIHVIVNCVSLYVVP